ncbi:hypothetical protein CBM2585_A10043 [Cupriavidus taiwanensis]|nr:hypothetical protein CBM2585_A10043 [Cupriavidus taiwanensis]SOY99729.1 hypothetical protein CBM2595_A10072 [Cupriavidus taiwanensis]
MNLELFAFCGRRLQTTKDKFNAIGQNLARQPAASAANRERHRGAPPHPPDPGQPADSQVRVERILPVDRHRNPDHHACRMRRRQ